MFISFHGYMDVRGAFKVPHLYGPTWGPLLALIYLMASQDELLKGVEGQTMLDSVRGAFKVPNLSGPTWGPLRILKEFLNCRIPYSCQDYIAAG